MSYITTAGPTTSFWCDFCEETAYDSKYLTNGRDCLCNECRKRKFTPEEIEQMEDDGWELRRLPYG